MGLSVKMGMPDMVNARVASLLRKLVVDIDWL